MAPAGGIERVISKHIGFLVDRHEVVVLTKDSEPSFYSLPASVKHDSIHIDMKLDMSSRFKRIFQIGSSFLRTVSSLRRKIAEYKPDIVYVASPLSLLEAFIALRSAKKIMVTEHSSFSAYNAVYKFIAGKLYKKVTLLTVPTKDDSRFYTARHIKNSYLPNPLPFFPEVPSTLEHKIVLNVGRFTDDKRHELLINLWKESQAWLNGWNLHLIGKGENEEKIKKQITDLNLQESVRILPTTKEIEKVFCNASIFVLTSRAEGFGLVLAEAMSAGVPCVTFNCPSGPKDIVTDQRNGYLVEEGDHETFLKRLKELMDSHELRKTLGTQARIDVKKFDSSIISHELNVLVDSHFNKK
jgi:glycosyltransferase involved in cell wall biosynthesis